MAEAVRDQNHVTVMLFESASTPGLTINATGDEATGRLYVDVAGGSGTVTSVSVVSANGFAGSVATATTTPAITISTTINAPVLAGNGTAISAATTTGSGSTVVLATSPTLVTPVLGVATATSINKVTFTAPVTGSTLTIADGKTLTVSNTLTFTGTDASSVAFGTGGTVLYTASTIPLTIGTTTVTGGTNTRILYNNSGVLGEYTLTGTGTVVVMATSPTFTTGLTTPQVLASANDSGALGASGTAFADLFLASGGVINWFAGDATITHSAGLLTTNVPVTITGVATADGFAPTSSTATGNRLYLPAANTLGFAINGTGEVQLTATALSPVADGGNSLGTTTLGWQNLFGNTGFVFNLENGDWVATHTAGILTVGTGDLRVTTAGTNSASVVTVGGTQTLTSKTLTSPTITTATLSGTQVLAENASIALDPAGSADGKYTGITIAGTAGATLAFGDLVYLAAADSRWELADADAATTSDRMMGMCVLAAAADGDPTVLLLVGQIRADAAFPALTIGSAVYVGETAGDIQVAIPTGADNVIRRVGYALTADEIYFNPSMDSQITVA